MTYRISETEFKRLKFLFEQPKQCWNAALGFPHLSEAERGIISDVIAGKMSVENVLGKPAARLPTDRPLSKQEVKHLYTKAGIGAVVCHGRPIHRLTRCDGATGGGNV